MAITAARLHNDPALLAKAHEEHQQATGGQQYRAPLGESFPKVDISVD